MRRLTVMMLSLTLAAAGSAWSNTVEVPLPGLEGWYEPPTPTRTVDFAVSFDPAQVMSAQFYVRFALDATSLTNCGFNGAILSGAVLDNGGSWTTQEHYIAVVGTELSYLYDLIEVGQVGWASLEDGVGTFEFTAAPRPLPAGCSYLHDMWGPSTLVYEAKLVFTLDANLPAEATSWGRIKALYR